MTPTGGATGSGLGFDRMIVILAPYGRTDATYAATRLADFAAALGHGVRLVAVRQCDAEVDPHWDSRVARGMTAEAVSRLAATATHVVHFGHASQWLAAATLADTSARKTRQILVPLWHSLTARDMQAIKRYDVVVCPSTACRAHVLQHAFAGTPPVESRLTRCVWDAGVPAVTREGTVSSGKMRVCVHADAAAIDYCGGMVQSLVDEILVVYSRVHVNLLSAKSWSRQDRAAWRRLAAKWGDRLVVSRAVGPQSIAFAYHTADWVLLPGVRSDFGTAAAAALVCGAAVICHDVAPFNEIVGEHSGVLVKCETRRGPCLAPIAVPDPANWLFACHRALSTTKTLFGFQAADWKLPETRGAFNACWSKVLA